MNRRRLRAQLLPAVGGYRGPVLREAPTDPELPPTDPPVPAPDPPAPDPDDDDRPMTRREFKAWQAAQAPKDPEKSPVEKAPAPPKKDPDPEPEKKDPEPEEDYPSAWFRPKKTKPRA